MPLPSASRSWLGLVGWLLLCFATAALGGRASADSGAFYQALVRPAWAPPGWLFGPVWGLLYFSMGLSAWLVWRDQGFRKAGTALALFLAQLTLNGLWTWLFFVWKLGVWAFVEILVLWALILATTLAFWRHRPLAGVLLLPYLAWVSFAAVLTYAVWSLNPQILS